MSVTIGTITMSAGRVLRGVRRLCARFPAVRWLPALTAATTLVVAGLAYEHDVDVRRDAWGTTVTVWVATTELAPGDHLEARRQVVPLAAAPDAPLDASAAIGELVARRHVGRNEIVTAADVVGGATPGALIPVGWLAVPVAERTPSGALVGDRVVVVSDGLVLADGAIVVGHVDGGIDGTLLVAVEAPLAPLVALATDDGVTLLRTPESGSAVSASRSPGR